MVIQPNLPVSPTAPTNTPTTVTHVPQPAQTQATPTHPGTIQTQPNTSNTPNGIASPQIESDVTTGVSQGARNLNGPEAVQRYDQLSNALPQLGGSTTQNQGASAEELTRTGDTAYRQGNFAAAESSFRQALQQPGLSTEQQSGLQFNLARSVEQQGRGQDAANEYGRFLEIAPASTDRSQIQHAQGEISKVNESSARQLLTEANNAYSQGNFAAAETGFRQALEHTQPGSSQHAEIQYNVARSVEQQGRTQDAATEFGNYLRVAPSNAPPSVLQHAHQVSGNTEPAPTARESLRAANTAYDQGNFAEATQHYRNALGQVSPTQQGPHSEIQYNLARSLEAQGRPLEAAMEYRRFLEIAPASSDPAGILRAQQFIAQTQQVPF